MANRHAAIFILNVHQWKETLLQIKTIGMHCFSDALQKALYKQEANKKIPLADFFWLYV